MCVCVTGHTGGCGAVGLYGAGALCTVHLFVLCGLLACACSLSNNQIGEAGAAALAEALKSNSTVHTL